MAAEHIETWSIHKPAVESSGGVVTSQHYLASDTGAQVLAGGGNAVDAAVATSFALGAVEPWMSGLGGGGFMLIYIAAQDKVHAIDFGMIAPQGLNPADYPLASGGGGDLFEWPAVLENRNVVGPHSFAVPGQVAGMSLALDTFGTRNWAESIEPAIGFAKQGMSVDWYATLKIAAAAQQLAQFEESRSTYLPDGFPPAGEWGGPLPKIRLGKLADTLEHLAKTGPRDFYKGDLAHEILADTREMHSSLAADDLSGYQARTLPSLSRQYRGATVHSTPGMTAGPTLHRTLELMESRFSPGSMPDTDSHLATARSLMDAYTERLASMGDADESTSPSCTTHLSVVDSAGNMVAITQTLLSVFGSRTMLPRTGILMNNGVMWFDPRPGRPNSMRPGARPLSNMCPAIVQRADGYRFAVGASGGRRIMPAVLQIISYMVDHNMTLEDAFHHGRIDVSGSDTVTVDASLSEATRTALNSEFKTMIAQHGVYPALYGCPNSVGHNTSNDRKAGAAFVMSPWASSSTTG